MRDLFFSECRRFRHAALIFTLVHLMLQCLIGRIGDILQQDWTAQLVIAGVFALAGAGFALVQIGSYRQPGRWLWLLHRPLPRRAIFGAIALASAAIIIVAVGLPALLTVLASDWLTQRSVDLRHYLAVPYLVLVASSGWLIASAMLLLPGRFGVLVLVLPGLLLLHDAPAWQLLLAAAACVVLLALIVYGAFQPDRRAAPDGALASAVRALPLLLGFYFLLTWGATGAFQLGQVALGIHPAMLAPAGGYIEASRSDARALLKAGLASSGDARAAIWQRQLGMLDAATLTASLAPGAARQQLSNQGTLHFVSDGTVQWNFSHDSMRFEGYDLRGGAARGVMGVHGLNDLQPFPDAPQLADGYLLTRHLVLGVAPDTQVFTPRVALPQDEQLLSPLKKIGGRYFLLTDRRLLGYAPDQNDAGAPYRLLWSVPLAAPLQDLERIDIVPLLDGTLVSVTGGRAMLQGQAGGKQTVLLVDQDGQARQIAERALGHDFPALYEHAPWWLSPVLHAASGWPAMLLADADSPARAPLHPARPAIAWSAAVLAALAAVGGGAWWLRAGAMPTRRKIAWLAACLVFGLPALAGLMVMLTRPRRCGIRAARTESLAGASI